MLEIPENLVRKLPHLLRRRHVRPRHVLVVIRRLRRPVVARARCRRCGRTRPLLRESQRRLHSCTLGCCCFLGTARSSSLDHWVPVRGVYCSQFCCHGKAKFHFARRFFVRLLALFLRNFCAFFSRFRQSDGDGLLAARHLPTFAAFSRSQRALFLPAHRSLHAFARCFSVPCHRILPSICPHQIGC
jgi:hypothetical protein